MRDTWNDVAKYVKKKAKTNLDDKIAKVRKERTTKDKDAGDVKDDDSGNDEGESDESSEEELSDDEMVEDAVKVKEADAKRKERKRKKNPQASETGVDIQVERDDESEDDAYFDSAPAYDETASFYTMNLSRPLLKAIEELKYVHPTPIQVGQNYSALVDLAFDLDLFLWLLLTSSPGCHHPRRSARKGCLWLRCYRHGVGFG